MKNPTTLVLAVAGALLLSCCQSIVPVAASGQRSPEPGIHYGMSKQQVIAQTSRTDKIVSSAGEGLITVGPYGPNGQRTRKTFMFMGGKLAVVNYSLL